MPIYEKLPNRKESRYVLGASRAQEVHTGFGTHFTHVEYPDPVTQTAHLAGKQLDHPPSYLRMRRYTQALGTGVIALDPEEPWFFEHKQKSGVKERIQQPLGEIVLGTTHLMADAFAVSLPSAGQVLQEFGKPLMPIFLTQSVRTHYQAPGARITVDEGLSYYGIRWGELRAYHLGDLDAVKAELKVEKPDIGAAAEEQFDQVCQEFGGQPASDGEAARDMFAAYQRFIEGE